MVISIINKCSRLAQKEYKIRQDLVGKVIQWELCETLRFDYSNKWDFEVQMDSQSQIEDQTSC